MNENDVLSMIAIFFMVYEFLVVLLPLKKKKRKERRRVVGSILDLDISTAMYQA